MGVVWVCCDGEIEREMVRTYQSYDLHEAPKGEEDSEQHLCCILISARGGCWCYCCGCDVWC